MNSNKKSVGFFIGLAACILAMASAIYYGLVFSGIEYKESVYDPNICVILAVVSVVATILFLVGRKTAGFAPVLICLGSGVSIMMFIKMIIWPVADTIYGIEPFPQINLLIVCAVMLVLTFVLAEVSLYVKKYKTA